MTQENGGSESLDQFIKNLSALDELGETNLEILKRMRFMLSVLAGAYPEDFDKITDLMARTYQHACQLRFSPPVGVFLAEMMVWTFSSTPDPIKAMNTAFCLGFAFRDLGGEQSGR